MSPFPLLSSVQNGQILVEVWNFADGVKKRVLEGDPDGDLSVAFSPDGKTLAVAGSEGIVKLWDTGTWELKASLTGHPGKVWSLAFSPDELVIWRAATDSSARTQKPP